MTEPFDAAAALAQIPHEVCLSQALTIADALERERAALAALTWHVAVVLRDGQLWEIEVFASKAAAEDWQAKYKPQDDEDVYLAAVVKAEGLNEAMSAAIATTAGEDGR